MKIVLTEINEKAFTPVELNIRIDTLEELLVLWKRFNVNPVSVGELGCSYLKFNMADHDETADLWDMLDNQLEKYKHLLEKYE